MIEMRIGIVFFLLAAMTDAAAQEDDALAKVLSEARQIGLLAKTDNWKLIPIPSLIALTDKELINQIADESTEISRPYGNGLLVTMHRIFRFGEPKTDSSLSKFTMKQLSYYDRILYKRRPAIIRWIPFIREYESPLDRSQYVTLYYALLNDWAKSVDFLNQRIAANAAANEVSILQKNVEEKRLRMEIEGSGSIIRMISYRATALKSRTYRLAWESASEKFIEFGGYENATIGRNGDVTYSNKSTTWHDISLSDGTQLKFAIIPLRRSWLDSNIILFGAWNWNSASPFHNQVSDEADCSKPLMTNCFTSYLIAIKKPLEEERIIGMLAEAITQQPSLDQDENFKRTYIPSWSGYDYDHVVGRLRNGTY